jgi:alpha-tubulin suppressor-like RCC1 family protein
VLGSASAAGVRATAITAGQYHTCAVVSGGGVRCWGSNLDGELGDGTKKDRSKPVQVRGLTNGIRAVSAGSDHTCAVADTGAVKCWGSNGSGALGDGTTKDHRTPVAVRGLSGVTAIAAADNELGPAFTCALAGGAVKCWGDNSHGQLGDGSRTSRSKPAGVSGLGSGVSGVAAAGFHGCAIAAGGGARCWGDDKYGQLGDGGRSSVRLTPVPVRGLSSGVRALAEGQSHTCALLVGGGVKCWGRRGAIGDGTSANRYSPVDVSGLTSGVKAIAAGGSHTCALLNDGGVKCWGLNLDGELGDGTRKARSKPVDVVGLSSGVTAIAAGGSHTCALLSSGGVKCWGEAEFGQLGDGSSAGRKLKPVDVVALG